MADFGMCRATTVYKVDLSKPLNVRWLAPEVWNNGETRFNTDVYAFGIMIWEFFVTPYESPYHEWKGYTVKVLIRAVRERETSDNYINFSRRCVLDTACHHRTECRRRWSQ